MRGTNAVKGGKFNIEDSKMMLDNLKTLVEDAGVEEDELKEELGAENTVGNPTEASMQVMMERQLVGFYLVQGMKDGDRRLPMEAINKVNTLTSGGRFTKEEDRRILAWVEEHGPTRWAELARTLGRTRLNVRGRYTILKGRQEGQRRGGFDLEELTVLMEEVVGQDPGALERDTMPSNIDWTRIGANMNRPSHRLLVVYSGQIHPTVRRSVAGTLEKDVRGELVEEVRRRGWRFGADVEFDQLARMRRFQGHTGTSLCKLYDGMLGSTMRKLPGVESTTEVTVGEVEEWWRNSERRGKSRPMVEKEEGILEAYSRIRRNLGSS